MSILSSYRLNIDPVLTKIAQGYSNEQFVSNLLLPEVPVNSLTGKYPIFGKEHLRVYNAKRPVKQDKIQQLHEDEWETGSYSMEEYAIEAAIDHLEIESANDVFDLEEYYAKAVMDGILLTREYNNIQMLVESSNYGSSNASALSDTNCWDNASSKPLEAINDAIIQIRSQIAKSPNVLVLGRKTYNALQNHSTLLNKIQYSQLGVVTEDLISQLISTKENPVKVVVGTGIYHNSVTNEMVDLWSDVAILAYVPQNARENRNKYEPSFGYCFVKSDYPKASREIGKYNITTSVAAFSQWDTKITCDTAGYLFTNTCGS
jgi:hypothetical protein